MSRPQTSPDILPHILAVAATDTVATRLAAIDTALAALVGHTLFTVLVLNWDAGENQRYYSNLPDAYPVGGAKPIVKSSASEIFEGKCRFLDDSAAITAAFFDHELIHSLGCESCVNIPVRWNGKTIGSMNILHKAHCYTAADIPTFSIFAALAAPALNEIIANWGRQA